MFEYSDKYIAALIQGIYSGEITEYDLPESLYHAIADHLKSGLYKGFGVDLKQSFETGDAELLSELRENIYMFSAAKTFQQVREMTDKLIDESGTVRNFLDFKADADQIFDTYNKNYLKTEYDTAIGQGQSAVKWGEIEKQKDVLPYLQYSTIGDACDICAPLDNLVAPVDDPVWGSIMPLNHFNCMCIVEQLDKEEGESKETPDDEKEAVFNQVDGKMSDVFKMNPGKDGVVFSENHPYFSVPKEDVQFAQNNFDLNIPKHD